jgi:hypothetical protein
MKRWAVVVAAPMATGLYVRAFCDLMDIGWHGCAQGVAASFAVLVGVLSATWAAEVGP